VTWLALLKRIPAIAYVIAFVVLLLAAGAWGLYASGRRAGEVRVHRKALADSIEKAALVQHIAVEQTDRTRQRAHEVKSLADSGRVMRNRLRESVADVLDSLPDPVVRLIEADDAQLRRDSLALAAYVAVDTTWARERALSEDLDRLRVNQVAVGIEPKRSHAGLYVLAGAGLALAGVLLVHAVR
jgi:hypothetical protein